MWATVSARIRGSKQELEDLGEETDSYVTSTSKLRDMIMGVTGFDIMEDENTYKDVYEIIVGIGKEWDKLSDIDRAGLLEALAGKRQSNALAAALDNVKMIEEVYQSSLDAEGSALRENQKYLESIQGHLDQFTNQWQEMWATEINRETINGFIDLGTKILELVDHFGVLKTAIITTISILSLKKGGTIFKAVGDDIHFMDVKLGSTKESFDTLKKSGMTSLNALKTAVSQTTSKIKAAGVATKAWAAILNILASIGIGLVINAITTGIMKLVEESDRLEESVASVTQTFSEFQNTVNTNTRTVKKLSDRYSELNDKMDKFGGKIGLTSEEYDEYLDICSQVASIMPELVSYYDDEGNAIIELTDNVNDLTEAYRRKTQAQAESLLTNNEIKDVAANYQDFFQGSGNSSDLSRILPWGGDSHWWDNYKLNFVQTYSQKGANKLFDIEDFENLYGQDTVRKWLQGWSDMTQQQLVDFVNNEATHDMKNYLNKMLFDLGYEDGIINSKSFDALHNEFRRQLGVVESDLGDTIDNIKIVLNQLISSDIDYVQVDDTKIRDGVRRLIGAIDEEFVNAHNLGDTTSQRSFANGFINSILANEDEIINAFAQFEEDMSLTATKQALKKLEKILGYDSTLLAAFFGLQYSEELMQNFDNVVSLTKTKFNQESFDWDSWFDEQSINTQEEIDGWLEIARAANTAAEAREQYAANKATIFDLTDHEKAIDNFQSTVTTLGDALSKIHDGSITDGELLDLAQEFISLDITSKTLEQDIQELIDDALENLLSDMDNPPEGLVEILNAIAQEAKNATGEIQELSDALSDLESAHNILEDIKEDMEVGRINISNLQKIIDIYPELEGAVAQYNAGLITEQELYAELEKQYNESFEAARIANQEKLYGTQDIYQQILILEADRINQLSDMYDLDLRNYTSLAEAKLAIQKKLAGDLTKEDPFWDLYFDVIQDENGNYTYTSTGYVPVDDIRQGRVAAPKEEIENGTYAYSDISDDFWLMKEAVGAYVTELNNLNVTFNDISAQFEKFEVEFGDDDNKEEVKEAIEMYDWYATSIERLEREITNLDYTVNDDTKSLDERNAALEKQIELTKQAKQANKEAAKAWKREFDKAAKDSGLSTEDINKIKDGTLSLEELDPNVEKDAKKIEAYEKLIPIYDTYLKYKDEEIQKEKELADLLEIRLEDIREIYNLIERRMTRLGNVVDSYMNLVNNTFLNYGSRLSNLSMAMSTQEKYQIPTLKTNVDYWNQKAKDFDLSDYDKQAIKFGANYVWEDKTPAEIEKYKEYAEILTELNAANDALREAQNAYADNHRLWFDLLDSNFSDKVGDLTQDITELDTALENAAYTGTDKPTIFDQVAEKNLQIAKTAESAATTLRKEIDKMLEAGLLMKDSQEHQELLGILEGWENQRDQANLAAKNAYVESMNAVAAEYDRVLANYEHRAQLIENDLAKAEAKGYIANAKYYEQLVDNTMDTLIENYQKKAALEAELAKIMAENPDIAEGSEVWDNLNDSIESVTLAIEQGELSILNYANAIRQIKWDVFDFLQDQISMITNEADFLIALMERQDQYDDKGQLNDTGLAVMGQHGLNYNVYVAQAKAYAKELKRINKDLANDPNDTKLIERKNTLLDAYQNTILAAEDSKYAIIDMVEEGINLELESLQSLIDSYNEALQVQKDLYDYQKRVANQTKTIAQLQKQLAAYENDKSEEARAKIQQIRVQLEEAQSDLDDTNYDHYLAEQQDLLSSLYEAYEEVLNQRLDNVEVLFADMINDINANSDVIASVIKDETDKVGYALSGEMYSIWNAQDHTLHEITNAIIGNMGNYDAILVDIDSILADIKTKYEQELEQDEQDRLEAEREKLEAEQEKLDAEKEKLEGALEELDAAQAQVMLLETVNELNTNFDNYFTLVDGYLSHFLDLMCHMSTIFMHIEDQFDKMIALVQYNATRGSNASGGASTSGSTSGDTSGGGSSSGGSSSGGSSGSSSTSSSKNKVNFKYKKNWVPVSELDIERSIEDRLKYHNYDESFEDRAQYYKEMGFSGTYKGTQAQNMKMLSWMKKNGYAKGARRINDDEYAWTQENGQEYIIRPSDGAILTPLAQGDSVLNAAATQHLWDMANNPGQFIRDNMLMSTNVPNIRYGNMSSGAVETNMEVQFVLPNVSDYNSFISHMQKDKKFEKMVQDMTINQLSGGSQMAKYKYKF